jgi:glycerol-3-phosphate dehydrogenase (NAD(P)+)
MSGPNLAVELAHGEPAATVVASNFDEVLEVGKFLLHNERFRVYTDHDVVGVEWAGTLKNILAIASGALDAMKLGWNARALLITRGLAEIVRFGKALGAQESTFLGLAGVGDLLATCSSPLSRNYRVGYKLAQGEKLEKVIEELGAVAEGVRTVMSVRQFANEHGISMPITEAVYQLLQSDASVQQILHKLMTR